MNQSKVLGVCRHHANCFLNTEKSFVYYYKVIEDNTQTFEKCIINRVNEFTTFLQLKCGIESIYCEKEHVLSDVRLLSIKDFLKQFSYFFRLVKMVFAKIIVDLLDQNTAWETEICYRMHQVIIKKTWQISTLSFLRIRQQCFRLQVSLIHSRAKHVLNLSSLNTSHYILFKVSLRWQVLNTNLLLEPF